MPEMTDLVRRARLVLQSGGNLDEVCSLLRAEGLPKVTSIVFLAEHLGLGMNEAKAQVHFSPAWADRQKSDDEFHDRLEQAVEDLKREDGESSSA